MQIELDVSLENPIETIDLALLRKTLLNNRSYEVLQYKPNNYLLLKSIYDDFKIRIHEDGRIYIKRNIDFKKTTTKDGSLKILLEKLKDFLQETHLFDMIGLKDEINFGFHGSTAHSFFWKKNDELNQIGKKALLNYDLRTYARTDDSIYVKLQSGNPSNIEACHTGVQ